MPTIFIRHNFNRIALALEGVSGKTLQKAVSRSIQRASKSVAKSASQQFRSRKLLRATSGELKKKVRVFNHAAQSKPVNEQYGEVHISGRPESLARFYPKTRAAGKSALTGVKLKRVIVSEWGRPYLDADKAFMANASKTSSKKIIYARQGSKRLPIQKQTGPSLGRLAEASGMLSQLSTLASERYEKEFNHNLEFYIQQSIDKAKGR